MINRMRHWLAVGILSLIALAAFMFGAFFALSVLVALGGHDPSCLFTMHGCR